MSLALQTCSCVQLVFTDLVKTIFCQSQANSLFEMRCWFAYTYMCYSIAVNVCSMELLIANVKFFL